MKFLSSLILIDASQSALNMAKGEKTSTQENITPVKTFNRGRDKYVYASSQSWRYWWRKTIDEHFEWNFSPLTRASKQVYTKANPILYDDDDVFGYMWAPKTKGTGSGVSLTRTAPLKNTHLVSLSSMWNIPFDEGFASRHEGDSVPYKTQFYSTILKGAFSLDLEAVGKFDLINKTGQLNFLTPENTEKIINESSRDKKKKKTALKKAMADLNYEENYLKEAQKIGVDIKNEKWIMPNKFKAKRASETIKSLKYLSGGAKQTSFLTDITPKFIIAATFEGGINPFINGIFYEDKGKIFLDDNAIINRIEDFNEILKPKKVFIGKDKGFMRDWEPSISNIKKELNNSEHEIDVIYGSMSKTIDKVAEEVKNYYKVES